MTERGLPIVGGAPACPFVAFEDDRDERGTSPDHRHRCYAEANPAPRALAHQEAYCLSSAFPVCPTFQDWARREAARARPTDVPPPAGSEEAEDEDDAFPALVDDRPPRRDRRGTWDAPPPWLRGTSPSAGEAGRGSPVDQGGPSSAAGVAAAGAMGGGLSGSFADRLISNQPVDQPVPPTRSAPEARPAEGEVWEDEPGSDGHRAAAASTPEADDGEPATPPRQPRRRERMEAGSDRMESVRDRDMGAPAWERPRRLEAYPTIRSRRWSSSALPTVVLGLVALLIAGGALFFGALLLGGLTPQAAASPTPSLAASVAPSGESAAPTEVAGPTPFLYTVKSGDNMFRIAQKFGVDFNALVEANKANFPDPNKINVGDVLVIPAVLPSEIPAAS